METKKIKKLCEKMNKAMDQLYNEATKERGNELNEELKNTVIELIFKYDELMEKI